MTKQSLRGKKVAITSGPTRAPIDAVRYISNRSTGALGVAIAEQCLRRGATVTLFHGVGSLLPRAVARLEILEIETVDDLTRALKMELPKGQYDLFFHAMAVLDYVPETESKGKIPSGKDGLTVRLVKTPKVINLIKELSPQTILVGFKLEVGVTKDELAERARGMMGASKSDFVIANDLRTVVKGPHIAYLLDRDGNFRGPFRGKENIASALIEAVIERLD
ncbi:phosphopantothenate--cysteine ligase [bacterium]|nr:phosphopantothenate--cysteine ligase [bacterium]